MNNEQQSLSDWTAKINVGVMVSAISALGALFLVVPAAQQVSTLENRNLASLPSFSWPTLYNGSYLASVDLYVADHFPFRDNFISFAATLRQLRGVHSDITIFAPSPGKELGMEDPAEWAKMTGQAQEGSDDPSSVEAIPETPEEEPLIVAEAPPSGSKLGPQEPSSGAPGSTRSERPGKVAYSHGILIYQGIAMQMFGSTERLARAYADVLNEYADVLPDQVAIYAIIVPTSISFNSPPQYQSRRGAEKTNTEQIFSFLRPKIRRVDAYSEMAAHTNENLFFHTDHHWTGRGAYYAYSALCKAAGLPPFPLERMERKIKRYFLGTLYSLTQDPSLHKPETVEYWIPPVTYEAVRYEWKSQKQAMKTRFLEEHGYGYGVFLGADYPLMVAKTSVNNGRHALVIKNSYGNPFSVFMLSSFQTVVVVDYRYFAGSVIDLMAEHQITDLVFMNVSFAANTDYHRWRIKKIMYGPHTPPKRPPTPATPPLAPGKATPSSPPTTPPTPPTTPPTPPAPSTTPPAPSTTPLAPSTTPPTSPTNPVTPPTQRSRA